MTPTARSEVLNASRAARGRRARRVLTDDEVVRVSEALRTIQARFNRGVGAETPMDVEFLLAGRERRLVFVQARPYPIRWDHDRGYAMPAED
ncbi:MAG: PEP/pyruvate-binding domain-containing protein [Polyangiales bacterium]